MRRLLPLALALLLPLFVVACGGGATEDTLPEGVETTQTGGGSETDAAPTDTAAATDTAAGDGAAEGDAEAGAAVYESAGCGTCHVFEPAGSTGQVGPNLDESNVDFEAAVQQIANGGGGMPAFQGQLSEEEIANVAAFVTQGR